MAVGKLAKILKASDTASRVSKTSGATRGARKTTQTRKQASREMFDESKRGSSGVTVTKITKPKTGNVRKRTGLNKASTPAKTTKVATKPTPKVAKSTPPKPLSLAQRKANDAAVKAGGKASANPVVKKTATKKAAKKTAKKTSRSIQASQAERSGSVAPPMKAKPTTKAGARKPRATKAGAKKAGAKKASTAKKAGANPKTKKTTAERNARRKKLLRARDKKRSIPRRIVRGGKTVVKKAGIPASSIGGGYLAGRVGRGNDSSPASTTKTTPSAGYSREQMLAARKAVYGY